MTAPERHIVVITGLSGSGKSTAIRALEDAGFFCIDNLPVLLLPKLTELLGMGTNTERLALGVDAREGQFLGHAPRVLDEARRAGHRVEVLGDGRSRLTLTLDMQGLLVPIFGRMFKSLTNDYMTREAQGIKRAAEAAQVHGVA